MRGMHSVEIVVYDGFDDLDAVGPFEVLAAAGFATALVTLDETPEVTTAHGLRVTPHGTLGAAPELLVVPGGGWGDRASAGAWAEVRRGRLPAAIAERHRAGSTVAAVCTGTMLVAAAGLLAGRPAVTHRVALDDLREAGADVHPEARVVDDGDLLSAGGVTSGIDLALHLVARERGDAAAAAAARRIEHEPRGSVLLTRAPA